MFRQRRFCFQNDRSGCRIRLRLAPNCASWLIITYNLLPLTFKLKNPMAIKYKLYQDNRAESKNRGKWYARAIYPKTPKSTKDLAQMIQDNVSVKRADVIAVLDELVNVMKLWLQESYRVSLDGLGSFKIGLKTKPADTAKDFSAAKHVVGSRVNFQPETHWSAADGNRRRKVFLEGLTVEETPENDVNKEDEP